MKNTIKTFFASLACLSLMAVPAQAKKSVLPKIQKNENYNSVRKKMLATGWTPFQSPNADTCIKGDKRCEGRPEMDACAGTAMANCRFVWKKQNREIGICTVGEDTIFSNFC